MDAFWRHASYLLLSIQKTRCTIPLGIQIKSAFPVGPFKLTNHLNEVSVGFTGILVIRIVVMLPSTIKRIIFMVWWKTYLSAQRQGLPLSINEIENVFASRLASRPGGLGNQSKHSCSVSGWMLFFSFGLLWLSRSLLSSNARYSLNPVSGRTLAGWGKWRNVHFGVNRGSDGSKVSYESQRSYTVQSLQLWFVTPLCVNANKCSTRSSANFKCI